MEPCSFGATGARGAGSGMLSTIDEAGARSRWWVAFRGVLAVASGGVCAPPFHRVGMRALDCAPGEQGCAGRDDGV